MKLTKKPKQTKTDYEQLGRMIENIYQTGYGDRKQIYKMSFIKGLLAGLGGVIGATIVVALLVWILSLFSNTALKPFVDPVTETLQGATAPQ